MKINKVTAELFYADGQTDMTKLTVAFRNFANAPKTPDSFKSLVRNICIQEPRSLHFFTCIVCCVVRFNSF